MSRELQSEMADYALAMPFPAMQLLEAFGAPRGALAKGYEAGWLGMARCAIGRGLWEPEGTERRLVLAVHDEWGELTDLLAISSTDRNIWALRRGEAWLLGAEKFRQVRHVDQAGPLRIFGTPLGWLQAGGWFAPEPAICVIDWTGAAVSALRSLGPAVTLVAEDAGAAEALRETLCWHGLPGVEIGQQKRRRAA